MENATTPKTFVVIYKAPGTTQAQRAEWNLVEVAKIATVVQPDNAPKALGVQLSGPKQRKDAILKRVKMQQAMQRSLYKVGDPACEFVLTKMCLGVSGVQNLLRCYGDELEDEFLDEATGLLTTTLERIAPGLTSASRTQLQLGINVGGAGLRSLNAVAAAASVASLTTAKPKIATLDEEIAKAGVLKRGVISEQHEQRRQAATTRLIGKLNPTEAMQVAEVLIDADLRCKQEWDKLIRGTVVTAPLPKVRWTEIPGGVGAPQDPEGTMEELDGGQRGC